MSPSSHPSAPPRRRFSALAGVALAVAACTLFAASGTIVRLGVTSGGDAAAIMIIQGLVTFVIATATAGGRIGLEKSQATGTLALGAAAGIGAICLVEGYARLGVAPVAALFALYPGVVGIGLWIFERRRPSALWATTLLVALAGVALAVGGQERRERPLWEYGFPVLATFAIAANDIIAQRVVVRAPIAHTVAWVNLVTTGLAVAAYNRAAAAHLTDPTSVFTGFALGICLYLALQFKLTGISRIGPRLVSLVAAGQPAIAVAIAGAVLRERLSLAQTVGIGLVALSLGVTAHGATKGDDD
jgi:drug/metabolite transporter (DMT)-like permease